MSVACIQHRRRLAHAVQGVCFVCWHAQVLPHAAAWYCACVTVVLQQPLLPCGLCTIFVCWSVCIADSLGSSWYSSALCVLCCVNVQSIEPAGLVQICSRKCQINPIMLLLLLSWCVSGPTVAGRVCGVKTGQGISSSHSCGSKGLLLYRQCNSSVASLSVRALCSCWCLLCQRHPVGLGQLCILHKAAVCASGCHQSCIAPSRQARLSAWAVLRCQTASMLASAL